MNPVTAGGASHQQGKRTGGQPDQGDEAYDGEDAAVVGRPEVMRNESLEGDAQSTRRDRAAGDDQVVRNDSLTFGRRR